MIKTQEPDIFKEIEVHYYDEGIFIKSTIDLKNYGIDDGNYNVPITIIANKKFGLKIIHGLFMYDILKIDYSDLAMSKAILMMSGKNSNWMVFIRCTNFNINNRREAIASTLEKLHNESYNIYCEEDYPFSQNERNENSHISFSFGLGVE